MTALRRLRLVAPIFGVLAILLSATAVLGHAQLTESDPAAGASVALPYTLVLRFDEELKPTESSVVIRNASGTVVANGSTVEDNFTMAVDLAGLAAGGYQAHWVAITADDNGKTQGDVAFNIVAATAQPNATPTPAGVTATTAAPSITLPPDATPAPTPPVIQTPAPSAVAPTSNPQAAGAELILPLVLAAAVAVAVAWLLLRRRQP